jgi:RNA polymerase sigma-70 factor (ECF subfamily)
VNADLDCIFRREAGRVLATLIRLVGDFDLAEEGLQDAFAAAAGQWPRAGAPANPAAWLVRVGRHKAIDRLRRRGRAERGQGALMALTQIEDPAAWAEPDDDVFGDDMLRLIFTCCHPALALEAQVALILRAVCGFSTGAAARAFLIHEDAMAQRLVRAKHKIRLAGIAYEAPGPDRLEERVGGVLTAIYLLFTEGYAVTSGEALIREDLCREAIRLARLLLALLPGRASIEGLLALMLLHDSRRRARATADGDIVLLEDQDRRLWDQARIVEGLALVDRALRAPGRPGAYAVQAAIAALHARAPCHQATDWPQIAGLYAVLMRLHPSPVIELNHAVAVSMVDGPRKALDMVEALAARGDLDLYHLLSAARAEMLRRLGRLDEARTACRAALAAARLEPERRLLARRLAELGR